MTRFRIDPIDVFRDATGSLFGRVLLFFSSGWLGFLIGRIAALFESVDDLANIAWALREVLADSSLGEEVLLTLFWPLTALVSAAASVPFFFLMIITVVSFGFVFLYTDSPSPLWWLAAVAVSSLVPPLTWEDPNPVSLGVLAFFWVGLGALAWWVIVRRNPSLPGAISSLVSGTDAPSDPHLTPRRKAPDNAWGRPVEGVDDVAADPGDEPGEPEAGGENRGG